MKLNIAFYTDTYEPAMDGVVSSINNFKGELERRGHKVYIFASSRLGSRPKKRKGVFFYPGIKFRPYPQYSVALFPYHSITTLGRCMCSDPFATDLKLFLPSMSCLMSSWVSFMPLLSRSTLSVSLSISP